MAEFGRLEPRLKEQYRIDQNRWLAEMGYMTMQRLLFGHGFSQIPYDDLPPLVRQAWEASAAAIRRRVVKFRLTAEQESPAEHGLHSDVPDVPAALVRLRGYWQQVDEADRLKFLVETLTLQERTALYGFLESGQGVRGA